MDQLTRAFALWPILTRHAARRETTTYGTAARQIGIHHRPLRYVLGPIQDYCLKVGAPPLTALVVRAQDGNQGSGYAGVPGRESDIELVWAFAWSEIPNPFGEMSAEEVESVARELADDPDLADDKYARVRTRGDQQRVFRRTLMLAYDGQCAICGITFVEALEAAHIISWSASSPSLRIDPRNGLLLCANHHRLFDSSWIGVTDTYTIDYSDADMSTGPYSDEDVTISVRHHQGKLRLPTRRELWPSLSLIRQRRDGA